MTILQTLLACALLERVSDQTGTESVKLFWISDGRWIIRVYVYLKALCLIDDAACRDIRQIVFYDYKADLHGIENLSIIMQLF